MREDPDASERPGEDDGELATSQRVVCTAVALVTGAGGGVGVFVDGASSAGVPVLLGIGALFGYIAISGQRLTRLKLGDNEAAFGRSFKRILKDPDISDYAKAEVAEHLDEDDLPLPKSVKDVVHAVLEDRRQSMAYERDVSSALMRTVGSDRRIELDGTEFADGGVVFTGPESGVIGIAVKWFEQPVDDVEFFRAVRPLGRISQFGILVTNQSCGESAFNFDVHGRSAEWTIVTWRNPADDAELWRAYGRVVNDASDESLRRNMQDGNSA
ncbi:hypothetical protein [Kribbella sp. CA-294648]|uniref:hypothetical protein n=1 Tax=Kribbella sp. CA-294648 TaxID=3239948 RepID=UPI003D93DFFB